MNAFGIVIVASLLVLVTAGSAAPAPRHWNALGPRERMRTEASRHPPSGGAVEGAPAAELQTPGGYLVSSLLLGVASRARWAR